MYSTITSTGMNPMIPAIFENLYIQWANNHHLWQTVAHYTNLRAVTSCLLTYKEELDILHTLDT